MTPQDLPPVNVIKQGSGFSLPKIKTNPAAVLLITIITAVIAIVSAVLIYQRRDENISPTAPTQSKAAFFQQCNFSITVSSDGVQPPEPTATSTPVPTTPPGQPTNTPVPPVATATVGPTVTLGGPTLTPTAIATVTIVPTVTVTVTIAPTVTPGGPTLTPTAIPTPQPTNAVSCGTACGPSVTCPSNMVCSNGFCRNPACTDALNCSCSQILTRNNCGGSCGSNNNCADTLYCSLDGYCRNPQCPSSSNCNCTVTQNTVLQNVIVQQTVYGNGPTPTPILLTQAGSVLGTWTVAMGGMILLGLGGLLLVGL